MLQDFAKSLVWCLGISRTSTIAWLVGIYVLGASYGSVLGDLDSFETNEMFKLMLLQNADYTMTEQFITLILVILATKYLCTGTSAGFKD